MLPEANTGFQYRYLLPGFEAWLRKKLIDNDGYAEIVHELLTFDTSRANPYGQGVPTPYAFYQAKESKPENLAASTSRIFLGLRIECAQCHDHPFDAWQRNQFWSFAAFFPEASASRQRDFLSQLQQLFKSRRGLKIPGTNQTVSAVYLDGKPLDVSHKNNPREALANWIHSSSNPYFARTLANRMWAHFFGIGIVEPVDDFSPNNPPSHPELLDLLASALAEHQFNLKFLIQAITASRTYQFSSDQGDTPQSDARLFSRMSVTGLTAEQLFDSVAEATGFHQPFDPQNSASFGRQTDALEFRELFSNDNNVQPTQYQTTVLQALTMMNGGFVAKATSLQNSQTFAAIIEFPHFTTTDQIDALYLATLSRQPRDAERERLVDYVTAGGSAKDSRRALSDVFWALLNSSEFMSNH